MKTFLLLTYDNPEQPGCNVSKIIYTIVSLDQVLNEISEIACCNI